MGYKRSGGGFYLGTCDRCNCHGHADECGTIDGLCIVRYTASFVTARCYASAVLAMGLCLSVRLSQVGVLLKRLNESGWFFHVSFLPPVLHCVKRKFGYLQE